MNIGVIGLGKMGSGVAARLRTAGHTIVGFDQNVEASHKQLGDDFNVATSLEHLVEQLPQPRVLWVALPSGAPTNDTIHYLEHLLEAGDTVCDAGNSPFTESKGHYERYQSRGFHFIDVGISGGLTGRENGYCLMVGGAPEAVQQLEQTWQAIAQPQGYAHVGPAGSGHYVKMVHNGIEYGLMQAYAEGLHVLADGSYQNQLNLAQIAHLWQHGSIIQGYLGATAASVLQDPQAVQSLAPIVDATGEGVWTLNEAISHHIPTPALAAAVMVRLQSKQGSNWTTKLLAALREAFGGHPTHRS